MMSDLTTYANQIAVVKQECPDANDKEIVKERVISIYIYICICIYIYICREREREIYIYM